MLSGDNGILQKATDAKTQTGIGQEKEIVALAYNSALAKKVSNGNSGTVTGNELNDELKNSGASANGDSPIVITFENGHKYSIDSTGNIGEYTPSVTDFVKIGDYVDYDPTRGVTDTSKLTYTSPTGSSGTHGNGYTSSETGGGQKFTAKPKESSSFLWSVISITNDKIEIVPTDAIKKDETNQNSGHFVLKGAIGYLYAEQELNEICKIYGYGYGADTSQVTTYKIGGPVSGEETTGTITGSGARSLTAEDINKFAKVGETADGSIVITSFTEVDSKYGSTTNPTTNIKYPTINTVNGQSSSAGLKNLKYTDYLYYTSKIENTNIRDPLTAGYYWVSTRSVKTEQQNSSFGVFNVSGYGNYNAVRSTALCLGFSNDFYDFEEANYSVKPVVTLKSNVIDISNPTNNSGKWGYAWKLK